ncbi:MAG: hypothetical protein F6K31_44510 [Symploca sp. SIO2G7]|nr:hypothetical protein [Symploca sp. SIO2G7]
MYSLAGFVSSSFRNSSSLIGCWIWNNGSNPNPTLEPNFIASLGLGLQTNLLELEQLKIRFDYGISLVDRKDLDSDLQDQRLHFSIDYNHYFY